MEEEIKGSNGSAGSTGSMGSNDGGGGSSRARMIAVLVTALALLAIAIPFVWEPQVDAGSATTASADGAAAADAPETAACMANPKPANFDFTMKDVDGNEVSLASYKGKVVLLNFWATWCGPCKAEIPGFVRLQEKYRDQLVIVGYSVDDTAEKGRPTPRNTR